MFKKDSSFIVLYTTNVEKTHDFYKALGVTIKELAEDKVVIQFSDFDIHFILDTTEPFDEYQYIAKPGNYGSGTLFYIETSDLQKAMEAIENAGGKIQSEIKENAWDCKEFLFQDPNGHNFALYEDA